MIGSPGSRIGSLCRASQSRRGTGFPDAAFCCCAACCPPCCAYARRGHAAAAAPRSRENLRRFTGHLRCCGRSGNPFNLPQTELGGMNEERGGPIFLPRGTRGGADPLDADATRRRPESGKGAVAIVKEVARPLGLGE